MANIQSHRASKPNRFLEVRGRNHYHCSSTEHYPDCKSPVDRLRATLDDLLGSGAVRFVLDLADVGMIDSSGIGLLVRYLTNTKQRGGAIKLLNPSKFAVQTLKMIGVLKVFEVFQDQGEALASFT